jgi:hypothetical protein
VIVTKHAPVEFSMQLSGEGRSAGSLVKLTVPEGTMEVPTSVSRTMAVQVEDCPTVTGPVQFTDVLVERLLTVMLTAPLVLVR